MRPLSFQRVASLIGLLVVLLLLGLLTIGRLKPPSPDSQPSPTPLASPVPLSNFRLYLARGELQAALYEVEAQAALTGWTSDLHQQAGDIWRDMGDLNRALPHWESAYQLAPSTDLLQISAEAYLARGEWGTAYTRLSTILAMDSQHLWALYTAGLLLAPSDPVTAQNYLTRAKLMNPAYEALVDDLLGAMGTNPRDPLISTRVGATLANAELWSLAENAFRYAAASAYPYPSAMAQVALMRANQGKEGSEWLQAALSLAPQNPNVRFLEGVYWRAVEDFEQSANALLTAISLSPANPTFFAELGNTYRAMGNLNDAEYWLQVALVVSGNDPVIQDALDRLYTEETLLVPEDYLAYTNDASARNSEPMVMSAQAWAQHLIGDDEAALVLIEQALSIEATNPRILFDKARIFVDIGRVAEAKLILQSLLASDTMFSTLAARLLESIE